MTFRGNHYLTEEYEPVLCLVALLNYYDDFALVKTKVSRLEIP